MKVFAAMLLVVLAACGPAPTPELTAGEIRQRAADRLAQVGSFRFKLEVLNGTMPIGGGLGITSIDGGAVAPDRLRMQVKARFANAPLELEVIGIGERHWLTNPLTRQWEDASGTLALPRLLHPERGIGGAIRRADQLEKRGRVTQGGVDSYHLGGPLPAAVLAELVGSPTAVGEPVETELWVGVADSLPRRIKLVGAVVPGEAATLERVLTLSDFDATIPIDPP